MLQWSHHRYGPNLSSPSLKLGDSLTLTVIWPWNATGSVNGSNSSSLSSGTFIASNPVWPLRVPGILINLWISVVTTESIFADFFSTAFETRVFHVDIPTPFTELQNGFLSRSSLSQDFRALTCVEVRPIWSISLPRIS